MQRVRRPVVAGLLVGAVALLAACSDPTPTVVPGAPSSSAAAPSTTPAVPGPTTSVDPPTSPPSTSTTGAAPTTEALPSSVGDGSVEPNRPVQTAAPKKLDEPASTAGVRVTLVSVRATTIKATGPGDRSGPGVLVRLRLVNSTRRTVDTGFTQVSLDGSAGRAGTLVVGAPSAPLDASLRAGRSTQGTYAFLLDDAGSAPVTVSVYVTSGQPVVTFRGRVS